MNSTRKIAAALVLSAFSFAAVAQQPPAAPPAPAPYGAPISLDTAKKAAAAAEAEARKNGWSVVIAIVDSGGNLVLLHRLDNTQIGSIEVARGKATTANNFRRPTKAFEEAITGGRTPLLRLDGVTPVEGGLPIIVDGKIVGAIGVSGVQSSQDAQVAKAGADALKP